MPMCSSIQLSSICSCSGVKPTAPSTPKPPALLAATTTSRQWVKAKIGNSMPSSSQIAVCMPTPGKLDRCQRIETCSSLVRTALTWPAAPDQRVGTTRGRPELSYCRRVRHPQDQEREHAAGADPMIPADGSRQSGLFVRAVGAVSELNRVGGRVDQRNQRGGDREPGRYRQ